MRWIKAVVIIAIVAAIIPTMIMVINRLPSEYKTERVEYEITITYDNITETVYELYNRTKFDENNKITNWLYVKKDGKTVEVSSYRYETSPSRRFVIRYYESHYTSPGYVNMYLDLDDPDKSNFYRGNNVTIGLYDEKVIESPSSLELLLISLVPLILVSGLLIYQYKELGLNKNE